MDISVSLTSVRGERQGIPKLTLNLTAEGQTDAQLAIISVTAAVRVTQEMTTHDMSKSYFIGTGYLESDGGQLSRNSKTFWQIGIPLSPHQLQKIEEKRSGHEIGLQAEPEAPAKVVDLMEALNASIAAAARPAGKSTKSKTAAKRSPARRAAPATKKPAKKAAKQPARPKTVARRKAS